MHARQSAFSGRPLRIAAFFFRELTLRVDACALAGVYRAPRFICDPFAPRALLLTPG